MAVLGACNVEVVRLPDGSTVVGARGQREAAWHQASIDLDCPRARLHWQRGDITSDWRPIHGVAGCGKSARYVCERGVQHPPFEDATERAWEAVYTCKRVR